MLARPSMHPLVIRTAECMPEVSRADTKTPLLRRVSARCWQPCFCWRTRASRRMAGRGRLEARLLKSPAQTGVGSSRPLGEQRRRLKQSSPRRRHRLKRDEDWPVRNPHTVRGAASAMHSAGRAACNAELARKRSPRAPGTDHAAPPGGAAGRQDVRGHDEGPAPEQDDRVHRGLDQQPRLPRLPLRDRQGGLSHIQGPPRARDDQNMPATLRSSPALRSHARAPRAGAQQRGRARS